MKHEKGEAPPGLFSNRNPPLVQDGRQVNHFGSRLMQKPQGTFFIVTPAPGAGVNPLMRLRQLNISGSKPVQESMPCE
jgi:hypothetical protein